eukprot:scaffold2276_cov160-Amphora_coffeaeformis.AAC.6
MLQRQQQLKGSGGWNDSEESSSHSSDSSTSSSQDVSTNHGGRGVADNLERNEKVSNTSRMFSFRRRGKLKGPFQNDDSLANNDDEKTKGHGKSWERFLDRRIHSLHRIVSRKCPLLLNQRCNVILFASLLFWMIVALSSSPPSNIRFPAKLRNESPRNKTSSAGLAEIEEAFRGKKSRNFVPPENHSVLRDAANGMLDLIGRGKKPVKKKEVDAPGCIRPDWHRYSFPTCNEVHGVDLRKMILRGTTEKPKVVGYLDSGLWRSVFAVLALDVREVVVLKMMKSQHDVDARNIDRHRRDALVMERLSGSPNVADIYGFCGNSVLTEFASRTVDDVIYPQRNGEFRSDEVANSQTPEGRAKLAMGVMRGLAVLHEVNGGPIVHADIQAKQFLVSSTGDVKVNDFNRCRIMASHKSSFQPCKFVIPTAPGKSRSPEEYKEDYLDEKLDVYSGANVLYGILTGQKAWYTLSTSETKKYVKSGAIPIIPNSLRQPDTLDGVLANLTEMAYEVDPSKRISAHQLVVELGHALDRFAPTAP